jgi:hypothetical protein
MKVELARYLTNIERRSAIRTLKTVRFEIPDVEFGHFLIDGKGLIRFLSFSRIYSFI